MPTINISDEEYKRRVQAIRNLFSRRIHDLYIKCANGEITEYHELVNKLHSLDFEYADVLEPYGLSEDLYTDDFDRIREANDNDVPLKDFAYQRLVALNSIDCQDFDPSSLMPPMSDTEDDEDDEDDDDI